MNDLISVIVPGYNVEKYVENTIESILKQTYYNLEIILVDDGSSDNTGKIFDKYKNMDDRIVVIHKSNGGLSDARNAGIKKANGKYLSFIDGDDYIDSDFYEILIKNIKNNNCDISVAGLRRIYNNKVEKSYSKKMQKKLSIEESINIINGFDFFDVSVCDKLFKKELFNDIQFKKGAKSEDMFIIFDLLFKSKFVYYDNNTNYNYVQRSGSITHDYIGEVSLDFIGANEYAIKVIQDNYPNCLSGAYTKYLFSCIGVYDKYLIKKETRLKKEMLDLIRKDFVKADKKIVKGKRKIQLLLIYYFPFLYDIIFLAVFKLKKLK